MRWPACFCSPARLPLLPRTAALLPPLERLRANRKILSGHTPSSAGSRLSRSAVEQPEVLAPSPSFASPGSGPWHPATWQIAQGPAPPAAGRRLARGERRSKRNTRPAGRQTLAPRRAQLLDEARCAALAAATGRPLPGSADAERREPPGQEAATRTAIRRAALAGALRQPDLRTARRRAAGSQPAPH